MLQAEEAELRDGLLGKAAENRLFSKLHLSSTKLKKRDLKEAPRQLQISLDSTDACERVESFSFDNQFSFHACACFSHFFTQQTAPVLGDLH